ncbi:MAG: hypothetical protein ACP5N1_04400 [Candidatus Woesearchaeota archaeon]
MGFMDFLKKKSDVGTGVEGMNFDSAMPTTDFNTGLPQQGFGADLQQQNLSPSMNMSSMGGNAFGQPAMSQSMPSAEPHLEKDLQMISLKLDAIKSELDAVNQRLKNLESIAEREQTKTAKKWY